MQKVQQVAEVPPVVPTAARKKRRTSRLAIALVGAVVLGSGAAAAVLLRRGGQAPVSAVETYVAKRGDLTITVSEGGTLQAERMERVRSWVHEGVRIKSIVPEGTQVTEQDVKDGTVLVLLDSSSLQDRLTKQGPTVEGATADLTRAKEDYQIQEMQNESNIRAAELNLKFARMDLESYLGKALADELGEQPDFAQLWQSPKLGGAALEKKTQLENGVRLVAEEVERAKNTYDWTAKLYEKKYVTGTELQADDLALKRQQAQLQQAQLSLQLFTLYEMPKEAETRFAGLREKRLELERVRSQANSQRAQASARFRSAETTFNAEKARLDDLKEQVEFCTIRAPKPGIVVYASSTDAWRRGRNPIEEGVTIYERQEIIYLPDLSGLVARIKVHESAVKKIARGQQAVVTLDAYPDLRLRGTVKDVAPLPDPQQFMQQDVKAFTTTIGVEGDHSDLKPGISCRAQVTVATLKDVVFVPVQAVTTRGDTKLCFVVDEAGLQTPREVTTGEFDDKFVEIKSGLRDGERVVLNPPMLAPEKEAPAVSKPETSAPTPPASPEAAPKTESPPKEAAPDQKGQRRTGTRPSRPRPEVLPEEAKPAPAPGTEP